MKIFRSILKILICLLLIFNSINFAFGQSKELTDHIREKLVSIDERIAAKDYNLALTKLEDLESYSNFISVKRNRLMVDLKRAKAYYGNNEQEKAMNLLLNGLDQLESLNFLKLKTDYTSYVGELFLSSKDYNRSLEYYKRSLISSNKIKDTIGILSSYLSIGGLYSKKKELDSAIHYYKIITDYPITETTENIIAKSYTNLSAEAGDAGDVDLAEEYSNMSIKIKERQKDTLGIVYALVNLSGINYLNGEYEKAENKYLNAYQSVRKLKSEKAITLKSNILLNLAYVNDELKDFESAFRYLEQATNLQDSLSQANITKNISEVEAKYNVAIEAEKVEKEKSKRQRAQFLSYATIFAFISMLVLGYIFYRNYRLKQQREVDKLASDAQIKIINATIDAKEMERKSIAEILHDSVSALLSSANLHLQATKAQLKTGYPQEITKAQTIVNEASVKIRDLSHDLISSVLLKFGLAFAVHDMCQKYSNSEISLFSDDDGVKRYEQDFEIKIHGIIEELVNNILKHSKAKNATIMMAHRENNMLSIRMNDDGVGFDPKIAKTKGGLGLSHIDARITVMKGVFNIVSSKDNGTSIFILVPIVPRA